MVQMAFTLIFIQDSFDFFVFYYVPEHTEIQLLLYILTRAMKGQKQNTGQMTSCKQEGLSLDVMKQSLVHD